MVDVNVNEELYTLEQMDFAGEILENVLYNPAKATSITSNEEGYRSEITLYLLPSTISEISVDVYGAAFVEIMVKTVNEETFDNGNVCIHYVACFVLIVKSTFIHNVHVISRKVHTLKTNTKKYVALRFLKNGHDVLQWKCREMNRNDRAF